MSIAYNSPRPPGMVREEIADLQSYLAGLPSEWREAGSFMAYEEKLRALDHELALGRIGELTPALTKAGRGRLDLDPTERSFDQARLVALLRDSERRYARLAAEHAKTNRWVSYGMLVASSATAVSALASISVLVVPAAAAAVGAAASMVIFRWSERSREEAKLADYLMALRNEVTHLQPASEVDRSKAGAFPTSARIEALIAEFLASQEDVGRSSPGDG